MTFPTAPCPAGFPEGRAKWHSKRLVGGMEETRPGGHRSRTATECNHEWDQQNKGHLFLYPRCPVNTDFGPEVYGLVTSGVCCGAPGLAVLGHSRPPAQLGSMGPVSPRTMEPLGLEKTSKSSGPRSSSPVGEGEELVSVGFGFPGMSGNTLTRGRRAEGEAGKREPEPRTLYKQSNQSKLHLPAATPHGG